MVTTPDRTKAAHTSPHELRTDHLLARRRTVVAWCDRQLMAIHALSTLMTDDPGVVDAALSEVLCDPVEPAAAQDRGEEPATAAPAPHQALAHPAPAHLPATRDRCPDVAASPFDRVELALHLIGDRSCAVVSHLLGLPERSVVASLRPGLWVLFTPCDGDSGHSPRELRSATAADHRHGPG
ncbi:hypothetical protein [Streptomyces sp. NBC_00343]|uniref:hypothetical protein n=1 Tax=Streptomyces sp. NBC_00343 TaxID=2975719 RepID=UPI002E2B8D80|nr:hypothetical protein [Streptomyces sp. NBC_00343]